MITCQPWDVQLHQVQGTCGLASCFFSKGLECGLPATCSSGCWCVCLVGVLGCLFIRGLECGLVRCMGIRVLEFVVVKGGRGFSFAMDYGVRLLSKSLGEVWGLAGECWVRGNIV